MFGKCLFYGRPWDCTNGKVFTSLFYGQRHRIIVNYYYKPWYQRLQWYSLMLSLVIIYINTFHSRLRSWFIDHFNNKKNNWTQIDYRLDPYVVKIFGGHVVCSRPCIGDLKVLESPIRLSFSSEGFVGLWAALCNFHGSHVRLFLCFLAP